MKIFFGQISNICYRHFPYLTLALLLILSISICINYVQTNQNGAAQQVPALNITSVEKHHLLDGISLQLCNVTFSHHTASVNGITLHYVLGGHGLPVVLLHGWPETWYAWHHVMSALAKNHTVIVPDLRGLGDSSKPTTGYDGKTVAEDIHQLVTQLGFKSILLVAHDIGAQTAYSYAATHPNNVSKLVIMDYIFPGFLPPQFGQNGPWW